MRLDRRSFIAASVGSAVLQQGRAPSETPMRGSARHLAGLPEGAETIELWPEGPPGNLSPNRSEQVVERSADATMRNRAISGISAPRLVVFRSRQPTRAAVIVVPGGGYRHVVIDKEGFETARFAAENGLTAFVLFYRLPHEGWADRANVPSHDAQRAVRLVRHLGDRFGLDRSRVAMIGFSAGGHVAADATVRAIPSSAPVDAADRHSSTPDCTALLYPVISMREPLAHAGSRGLLLGDRPSPAAEIAHSPEQNVSDEVPPIFLAHAEDDRAVSVQNSLVMRDALKARGISVETHLFARGGHGFGMRTAAHGDLSLWPHLWLAWMKAQGVA